MAEQDGFEQLARDRAAIDGDEGLARRAGSAAWMARATTSLPLPDGPVSSTEASLGATWRTMRRSAAMAGASPTIMSSRLAPPGGAIGAPAAAASPRKLLHIFH